MKDLESKVPVEGLQEPKVQSLPNIGVHYLTYNKESQDLQKVTVFKHDHSRFARISGSKLAKNLHASIQRCGIN